MKSTFGRMALSLCGLCVAAGGVLALVSSVTSGPIADAAQKARLEAIGAVLPEFSNNPADDAGEYGGLMVYRATDSRGNYAGAAVESYSDKGFSGRIRILAGFDSTGTLWDYRVLEHSETPGLGSRMETWFRDPDKEERRVTGRREDNLRVRADGGDIDGISGATISSRAFLEAINKARQALMLMQEARREEDKTAEE